MRLTRLQVTNFKSIEDSTEFSVGDLTCLVGKNEAGKTALLQALHKLKPDSGSAIYDVQNSYPRRFLSEYADRHPDGPAQVLKTTWELDEPEVAAIKELVGPNGFSGNKITICKSYDPKGGSIWTTHTNEAAAAEHLIATSDLHDEEKTALESFQTVASLKKAIAEGAASTDPRHKKLLDRINAKFARETAGHTVIDFLGTRLPTFVYFSNYDRMAGQIALESLVQKQNAKAVDKDDRVFLAFLGLAGTTLDEMAALSKFETMVSKLEAVSSRISKEIFAYWSQNRNLRVQFRLDTGRSGDPPPFNSGNILRTRIENTTHEVTVSFDDRSTGFVWFFSLSCFHS